MRRKWVFGCIALILLLSACGNNPDGSAPLIATGFIEGKNYAIVTLYGGRVADVLVTEGQDIAMGEILVHLEDDNIRQAVSQARAALDAAEAQLRMLASNPTNVDRTAMDAAVAAAETELIRAQAELDILVDAYDPYDPPEAMLQPAELNVAVASANLDLAEAQQALLLAGAPDGTRLAAEAAVREAEASLQLAEEVLLRMSPAAPIDGRIAAILVQAGETVPAGTTLLHMLDPDDLVLTIYIPQERLTSVSIGDEVSIQVDAFPGEEFTGTVSSIAEEAQFTPSTVLTEEERVKLVFEVSIEIVDPQGRLHAGMPADARILP